MKGLTDGAETKRATGRTRPAEISPSAADLTEGIAFGLDEDDSPVVPVVNPLGGRPQGSTLEASRKHRKVREGLVDSAAKAYYERKVAADGGRVKKGAMDAILAEQRDKYQKAHPGAGLEKTEIKPMKTAIYQRVLRHEARPEHHRLIVEGSRGPASILASIEPLLLAFIAEAAEVGIYMNTGDLRPRMADLMSGKPIGAEYAQFAAAARGVRDAVGYLVVRKRTITHQNTACGSSPTLIFSVTSQVEEPDFEPGLAKADSPDFDYHKNE